MAGRGTEQHGAPVAETDDAAFQGSGDGGGAVGDVDEDYLAVLALDPDGWRRFDRLSFAAHFDKFMYGRRDIERPPDEKALNPYRQRFADMFAKLRREHGVRYFLAHNMTVTPGNLDEVADVIRDCHAMGYGLFSFQPGRRTPLEGELPGRHPERRLGRDRTRRRRHPGLPPLRELRRALQPHRVRLLCA